MNRRALLLVALWLAAWAPAALRAQGPTLPSATLVAQTVTLQPSGGSFIIPNAMFSGPLVDRFTMHGTRDELNRIKSPAADEWDGPYSAIVNAVLPFDACAVHIGTEPFGAGRKFSDLQMRVYLVREPVKAIFDRVGTLALNEPNNRFRNGAVIPAPAAKRFDRRLVAYDFRGADYAADARVDFFAREFGDETVVFVFMYVSSPRFPWADHAVALVDSFNRVPGDQ